MRGDPRAAQSTCDPWWNNLTHMEKSAIWILMRMVEELKAGGRIEVRRSKGSFRAWLLEPEEIQKAALN
jgi:hypothetical protein